MQTDRRRMDARTDDKMIKITGMSKSPEETLREVLEPKAREVAVDPHTHRPRQQADGPMEYVRNFEKLLAAHRGCTMPGCQ